MTLRQIAERAVAAATESLAAGGVVAVVVMMVITTGDVLARYVFNRPSMWADEIASYLLIAIVFLGLAQNLRQGSHIRIDVVTNLLSPQVRLVIEVIAFAIGIVFSVVLLAGAWARFDNFWMRHVTSDSPLMTPLWIAMVPVLLGAVALVLAMLLGFVSNLHSLLSGRRPGADA